MICSKISVGGRVYTDMHIKLWWKFYLPKTSITITITIVEMLRKSFMHFFSVRIYTGPICLHYYIARS